MRNRHDCISMRHIEHYEYDGKKRSEMKVNNMIDRKQLEAK